MAARVLASRTATHGLLEAAGWALLFAGLGGLALLVPRVVFVPGSGQFILAVGAISVWRYGMGVVHFLRGMVFLHVVYPICRRRVLELGDLTDPSHLYFMITSYRIDAQTTARVYDSVIREAVASGWPATVVCSIVEMSDETIVRQLWRKHAPPERVSLKLVRIAGTGKRDGLAYGFRAVSRELPDNDAIVVVVDGDSVLNPGVVRACAPYFRYFPNMGALTTNEFCEVQGGYLISEWHKLRFAQRHINMCSMALSNRVLTLTGRMSIFRASVVTNPAFIADIENDHLNHWRLGEFRFLTGDDKSSWYSLMRLGWDTWYVPDAYIRTIEHPPHPSFLLSSLRLMFRWYGNSLRQNYRATGLGIRRLGPFTYYMLWDQRLSMWTGLFGLTAALIAALKYNMMYLAIYVLWIGFTRSVLTLMLSASGHRIGPVYPFVLYYNQILGSLVKIYVFFRLDRQTWTRQQIRLSRELGGFRAWFNAWSSMTMTFSAASLFCALMFLIV
ncbi:MAG TPA: glycosyltransferase family 2 protein [Gammaproteobacteria bacterium]|nr:glycosyltransferase family 2 protein [Gammaproteobacteria bacterium]